MTCRRLATLILILVCRPPKLSTRTSATTPAVVVSCSVPRVGCWPCCSVPSLVVLSYPPHGGSARWCGGGCRERHQVPRRERPTCGPGAQGHRLLHGRYAPLLEEVEHLLRHPQLRHLPGRRPTWHRGLRKRDEPRIVAVRDPHAARAVCRVESPLDQRPARAEHRDVGPGACVAPSQGMGRRAGAGTGWREE